MPRLCGFYLSICLTTEEKAQKNLSQGSHTVEGKGEGYSSLSGNRQVANCLFICQEFQFGVGTAQHLKLSVHARLRRGVLFDKSIFPQLVKKFPALYLDSLPFSQQPANVWYCETAECSTHTHVHTA